MLKKRAVGDCRIHKQLLIDVRIADTHIYSEQEKFGDLSVETLWYI
jgi:hypothetical protein